MPPSRGVAEQGRAKKNRMQQTDTAEKRRHGRHRPEQLACNLGQVMDLSLGGMRVVCKRARSGSQTVVLETPRLGRISITARVAWRRELGPKEHVVGLTFEELSAEVRPVLQALMREVAEGVSQASRGRFSDGNWWIGVITAVAGVALVAAGQSMEYFGVWAPRWLPQHMEAVEPFTPFARWIGLVSGGLLVLTGLSEMKRRPTPGTTAAPEPSDRRRPATSAVQIDQLQRSQHLLNGILESSLGGVAVLKAIHEDGRHSMVADFEIQLVNRAAEDLLGKNQVTLVGKRMSKTLPCLMQHVIFDDLSTSVGTGLPLQKQYRMDTGKWFQLAVVQLTDGLAVTFADTTEQQHAQARLRHVAYHDELTGLPNRKLLMEHLENAMARSRGNKGHKFAVLFLDFDRFKLVNDTLGHEVGDLLLNSISRRLRENIRDVDNAAMAGQEQLPARLGGDEFVVMLDGIAGEEDAVAVARRLLETFSRPHVLDGHRVVSTASIGIVISRPEYDNVDDLLRDADTAMYEAKHSGKARYVMFDQHMHETLVAQAQLEHDLREAVAREDFTLVYEPIIDLPTGRVAGFETLLRWKHATRGDVSPEQFVPMAEELNLIVPIGEWVIKKSCLQLARWRDAGTPDVYLNINLSRAQLYDGDLAEVLREQIDTHGLDPATISLEITETMVMNDVCEMAQKLYAIKRLGVRLALDDFGTGHSSLNVLHELPLDILKIDRTFIASAGDSVRRYGAIIATITELAKNLDMQVIAEGIEREEQVALLLGLNCDYAQGWLFSRPVDADSAAEMLAQGKTFAVAA